MIGLLGPLGLYISKNSLIFDQLLSSMSGASLSPTYGYLHLSSKNFVWVQKFENFDTIGFVGLFYSHIPKTCARVGFFLVRTEFFRAAGPSRCPKFFIFGDFCHLRMKIFRIRKFCLGPKIPKFRHICVCWPFLWPPSKNLRSGGIFSRSKTSFFVPPDRPDAQIFSFLAIFGHLRMKISRIRQFCLGPKIWKFWHIRIHWPILWPHSKNQRLGGIFSRVKRVFSCRRTIRMPKFFHFWRFWSPAYENFSHPKILFGSENLKILAHLDSLASFMATFQKSALGWDFFSFKTSCLYPQIPTTPYARPHMVAPTPQKKNPSLACEKFFLPQKQRNRV